jgi:hypothetical protein
MARRLWRAPKFKLTRDLTMFLLGGGAFVYEVVSGGDRPNILYGSMALMGVAAYLRAAAGDPHDPK